MKKTLKSGHGMKNGRMIRWKVVGRVPGMSIVQRLMKRRSTIISGIILAVISLVSCEREESAKPVASSAPASPY
ncbi:MAG: hypothetical protein QE273_02515, partial [Verrucomicrobiales bacterium]|nr:hypothetical protein [Verrucomicrobiales bacterium]